MPHNLWRESMRMIDMFRTQKQRAILSYLERCHIATSSDIAAYMGEERTSISRHLRILIEDGLIHICGYYGGHNIPIYALVMKR